MVTEHTWIFDWNTAGPPPTPLEPFQLFDETLRDGVQSPSACDPGIEDKLALLHMMGALGIQAVNLGLPGAGPRVYAHALRLAQEINQTNLSILPACAARTSLKDIRPIAEISQKAGLPVEVYTFIGSSPIRMFAEGWDIDTLLRHIDASISFAVAENLPVCLVTEDTTRSHPDVLRPILTHAVALGAGRLCLCDTVGHAVPWGIKTLFAWVDALLLGLGSKVQLDWHGHNDRGLGLSNAMAALQCGAQRIHGTGLGIGERVGNASIDQILVNLKLLDMWSHDLSELVHYCEAVARACRVPIPYNYPLVGRDAFRTGTGVHAAAIIKAQKKSDAFMADRIYSGVPANMFGRQQEIEIGHMSGLSNVIYWLESRHIVAEENMVREIYSRAKDTNRLLTEAEVMTVVQEYRGRVAHE